MSNLRQYSREGGGKSTRLKPDDRFYYIDRIIDEALDQWVKNNPEKVADYRSGKKNVRILKNSNVIYLSCNYDAEN